MAHLGHYLADAGCERIVLPIDAELAPDATAWLESPVLPPGFDEAVLGRIARLRESVTLRPWPSNLEPPAFTSDVILDWDVRRTELEPWAKLKARYRLNRTLFEVDWRGTRLGASWFAEAAKVLTQGRSFNDAGVQQLEAMDHDLSEGVRIACNTVVLDTELMNHVKPHFLTFADPIFHFGPSTYAQAFQRAVMEQAREHDFMIVTTERFAALLRLHVPQLAARVVGLRQGTSNWPDNFDLLRHPAVKPYPNVLTLLMLPLAASLAESIGLIGFDGRAPEDTYFWRHGSSVQLDGEMKEIRDVHPGFFDLDYEDYYNTHLTQLEVVIRRLEARGTGVHSMAYSHMPPLRRRSEIAITVRAQDGDERAQLVSLTPDWIDEFGHFGPFERRIHKAAADAGFEHIALASAGLKPTEEWQIPAFVGPLAGQSITAAGFGLQLTSALNEAKPTPGSVVMFYAADVWHIPPILEAARRHSHTRFIVNVMKAHEWIASALHEPNPWARGLGGLLKSCLSAAHGTNVDITVDTDALARDVETLTGHGVETWPMVTVSAPREPSPSSNGKSRPVHVLSPVYAQHRKGFTDVVDLSEQLRPRLERGQVRLSTRFAPQPIGNPLEIQELSERLVENGGILVHGHLSDQGFADLIASADVVFIPYRTRPFRTRTSAVVLDALIAGKPVVTVRGTWAGELVERFGAGVTYEEEDTGQMTAAIDEIIDNLDVYHKRVAAVRESIANEFSPRRLIEFLGHRVGVASTPPSEEAVRDVMEKADLLHDLFASRTRARDSHRVDLAVARDDRQRAVEDRRDHIDTLEGSVAWHRDLAAKAATRKTAPNLDEQIFARSAKARLDEVELIATLVDPESRVAGYMVDVGAHHGSALGQFLRRGWAVSAFEPDVRHFEYLEARYGRDERVTLDRRAVTSVSGETRPIYISEESTGVSALAPFLDSHLEAWTVETVALKDVLDNRHVNVLKVDTEGFDMSVLEGFPWDRDEPDVIVCEFEDRKTKPLGYTVRDLGDLLVERGYQVWMSEWHPVIRYGRQHDWHRLSPYPCDPSSDEAWGNFIAFKQPRGRARLASALAACLRVEAPAAQPKSESTPRQRSWSDGNRPVTQGGGDEPNTRGERSRMREVRNTLGRRQAVLRSLKGAMRPVVATTLAFAGMSAVLAILDQEKLALISGSVAIALSVVAVLIVATRLERRSQR
jgi:FkbM family methyltransferase